ncbi:MAG: hypothetical protein ACI81W_000423, partial [Saprospiraceae bacterium]
MYQYGFTQFNFCVGFCVFFHNFSHLVDNKKYSNQNIEILQLYKPIFLFSSIVY